MIKYNYEVSVNENRAKLNKDIFLFRGNRNIHYYFSIKGARFAFEKEGDLIENANAIYAAVTVIKPNGVEVANAIAPVENGLIHLKVTEDLIDEEVEIGDFDLVFDLFDDSDGAVTIPKIKGQFHVQERPCTTSIGTLSGNVNVVNQAVVDLAIATQENEQLIVVDDDGKYVKTTWAKGDKISVERLNKMEEGIYNNSSRLKNIGTGGSTNASDITITDVNDNFESANVEGALNELGTQYKDIAKEIGVDEQGNFIALQTVAQTIIGAINELKNSQGTGSGLDLSSLTITTESVTEGTKLILTDRTTTKEVTIPSATTEQVKSVIDKLIADGTLSALTIKDNSITPIKTDFFSYDDILVSNIELTKFYDATHEYWSGIGSQGTNLINITNANKLYVQSTNCHVAWISYFVDGTETVKTNNNSTEWFWCRLTKNSDTNINKFECDLSEFKKLGATGIKLGFIPYANVDINNIKISLVSNELDGATNGDKILSISDKYKNAWDNKIDVSNINFKTKQEPLVDIYKYINTGYSGTLQTQFGSNKNLFYGKNDGYVDVSTNKTIYFKTWCLTKTNEYPQFGCYDVDKKFLYLSTSNNSNVSQSRISEVGLKIENSAVQPICQDKNGADIYNKQIFSTTFPDEVAYVIPYISGLYHYTALFSYEILNDFDVLSEDYYNNYNDEIKKIIQDIAGEKEEIVPIIGVFIGDSLTAWGGGSDGSSGFLKVVHDKTGMLTTNQGYAGAWWQTGDGQTYCAVNRVNTLIKNGIKYDLYCFIMGTNAGSNTDTGETSEDTTTMCGAIRYCLEKLKAYDPTAQILVCLPPQRAEGNSNQEKVNEVIKSIANSYSVKTLDIYHESGIVPNTVVSNSGYLSDGLHLGENGKTMFGNLLASEIKYLFCL